MNTSPSHISFIPQQHTRLSICALSTECPVPPRPTKQSTSKAERAKRAWAHAAAPPLYRRSSRYARIRTRRSATQYSHASFRPSLTYIASREFYPCCACMTPCHAPCACMILSTCMYGKRPTDTMTDTVCRVSPPTPPAEKESAFLNCLISVFPWGPEQQYILPGD
jgi:hypothetical protein